MEQIDNPTRAYKGTDRNIWCYGFLYELGKIYTMPEEKIEMCRQGFHACINPLDVWTYYGPADSRFFEVEVGGKIIQNSKDTKICASQIKLIREIDLEELIKAVKPIMAGDYAHSATAGNYAHSATAGNGAHSATAGNYARSATAGDNAHSATAGNYAHSATAGNGAHSATAGNYARSATAGDYAHSATSGYYAHSATAGYGARSTTAGDYAHSATAGNHARSATAGKNSIACALGCGSRTKAGPGGAIVLADWGDDGTLRGVYAAKVGEKIKGVTIKADTWYWFENGELKFERTA